MHATQDDALKFTVALSVTSTSIFLQPLERLAYPDDSYGIRSASNISSTIGQYVSSASKAWSDGYNSPGSFTRLSVDATKEPRLALLENGPLAVTREGLTVAVLGLMAAHLLFSMGLHC